MANRWYELLIALDPALPQGDADALLDRVHKIIGDAKGQVKNTEKVGIKPLAFKVHGKREANFLIVTCEAPREIVPQVEGVLRLHEGVLRYMTTRLEAFQVSGPAAPAPAPAAPSPRQGSGPALSPVEGPAA